MTISYQRCCFPRPCDKKCFPHNLCCTNLSSKWFSIKTKRDGYNRFFLGFEFFLSPILSIPIQASLCEGARSGVRNWTMRRIIRKDGCSFFSSFCVVRGGVVRTVIYWYRSSLSGVSSVSRRRCVEDGRHGEYDVWSSKDASHSTACTFQGIIIIVDCQRTDG